MGFFLLPILGCLGVLALVVAVIFGLTKRFYFRWAVRTWWVALYAELFLLVGVGPQQWPLLVNFLIYKGDGFWYLLLLVIEPKLTLLKVWHGEYPDIRLLLLLPLLPALVALGFDLWRNRRSRVLPDGHRP